MSNAQHGSQRINAAEARAKFDARRARPQLARREAAPQDQAAPWLGSLRADAPRGGPGHAGDYDEDEFITDMALRRGGASGSPRGLRAPLPPRKGDMVMDAKLPSTFDEWRDRGRQADTPLAASLDKSLSQSMRMTSPSRGGGQHYSYAGGSQEADEEDAVLAEMLQRRDVAARAREYYSAASNYSPRGQGQGRRVPAAAARGRGGGAMFTPTANVGGGDSDLRMSAGKLREAQERFKLKMWRMLKAVELATAHREALQSEHKRLSEDLEQMEQNTQETTTKRYKSEAKTTQLTQDRETTLSHTYNRRRDMDNARASTRTWADKAATVLKQLKEVRARRSARMAEARGRVSMRGVELDKREKKLRSQARKLEVAVDDIRVEVARKHEALAVHDALIAEARAMHRSLALRDEGRLSAAEVGAKRASAAKLGELKQRIAMVRGEIVQAKQEVFAIRDSMLEESRLLENGRVSEKSSMAQLAMLRLQDDTERLAVDASRAALRLQDAQQQKRITAQ